MDEKCNGRVQNPCRDCVKPKRHPGCHDTCEERKTYVETTLNKIKKYEKDYSQSKTWTVPGRFITQAIKKKKIRISNSNR